MSAALLTKRQAILPGSLQLSPKRRCKIRHFCLQISGICTCKKQVSVLLYAVAVSAGIMYTVNTMITAIIIAVIFLFILRFSFKHFHPVYSAIIGAYIRACNRYEDICSCMCINALCFLHKKEPLRKYNFKEVYMLLLGKALEGLNLGFSFSLFCSFMSLAKWLSLGYRLLI